MPSPSFMMLALWMAVTLDRPLRKAYPNANSQVRRDLAAVMTLMDSTMSGEETSCSRKRGGKGGGETESGGEREARQCEGRGREGKRATRALGVDFFFFFDASAVRRETGARRGRPGA